MADLRTGGISKDTCIADIILCMQSTTPFLICSPTAIVHDGGARPERRCIDVDNGLVAVAARVVYENAKRGHSRDGLAKRQRGA